MNVCRCTTKYGTCSDKKGLHETIKEERKPMRRIRRTTTLDKTCVEFYEVLDGKERILAVLSNNDLLEFMILLNEEANEQARS